MLNLDNNDFVPVYGLDVVWNLSWKISVVEMLEKFLCNWQVRNSIHFTQFWLDPWNFKGIFH